MNVTLLRTSPIQAEKLRPDRKVPGSATLATSTVASIGPIPRVYRAHPKSVMKALARLVRPVPGQDHPIKLQNLLFEPEQVSAERGKARTGNFGHPSVDRAATTRSSSVTPLRPIGATMPNSAR